MDVSVIIISYNTCAYTLQCLSDVYKYTKNVDFEIIVVDNDSKDATVETISKNYPEVKLILNKDNIGFGAANNQAIKVAKGEFVFLLNSDAFLLSNAIHDFLIFMRKEENKNVAVAGGSLYSGTDLKICSSGNFPSLLELFLLLGPYLLMQPYFRQKISTGVINQSTEHKKVDYIIGADMFIRKSVLEQTGAFDEDFFLNYEETELCYRINRSGYDCMLLPEIKIIHKVGGSYDDKKAFNYFRFHHYERSRIMFYRKCYGNFQAWLAKVLVVVNLCQYAVIGRERNLKAKVADIVKL